MMYLLGIVTLVLLGIGTALAHRGIEAEARERALTARTAEKRDGPAPTAP